jgi:hypothetical protein
MCKKLLVFVAAILLVSSVGFAGPYGVGSISAQTMIGHGPWGGMGSAVNISMVAVSHTPCYKPMCMPKTVSIRASAGAGRVFTSISIGGRPFHMPMW